MKLNQYQYKAKEFVLNSAYNGPYLFTGLAAEAGEVCGKYAKFIRDSGSYPLDEQHIYYEEFLKQLRKECGDVLWFLALIGDLYGFTLEEMATENIEKLTKRKEQNKIRGSGDDR